MSKQDIGVKVCSKEAKAKRFVKRVKRNAKPMLKHAAITHQLNQLIFGGNTNGQFRYKEQPTLF